MFRPEMNGPDMVNRLLYNRGKLTKLIGYALFDRITLKEKVKNQLSSHKFFLRITTKAYRSWKKIRHKNQ